MSSAPTPERTIDPDCRLTQLVQNLKNLGDTARRLSKALSVGNGQAADQECDELIVIIERMNATIDFGFRQALRRKAGVRC